LVLVPGQAAPRTVMDTSHARPVCAHPSAPERVGCFAWVRTDAAGKPSVSSGVVAGLGQAQLHSAYQLPTTSPVTQTIGIVDAYNDPNVFTDLKKYDTTWGLPAFPRCNLTHKTSCFKVMNQSGKSTPLPASDAGWGLEISLDVQVAHAMCQNCKVLLVEAASNAFSDLEVAVNTAVAKGAAVVSNSYGDFGSDCREPGYDHPHVAMVVASGDNGYQVSCPASLNTVVSVGGTHLTLGSGGSYGSESVWSGSGSGCSTLNGAQAWQTSVSGWAATACGSFRGMNDVAADADPGTGAAVYDSFGYGGWLVVGGTSLSAPIIAGTYALAGNAATWSYPAQSVYAAAASSLHDVTTGSNGHCHVTLQCHAGVGFDLPTGVGTPKGIGGF